MKNNNKTMMALLGLGILSSLGIQFSFVWGSELSCFSLASMMLPLAGMFLNAFGCISFVGLFFAAKWLIGFAPLTFGIPTMCQAANWSLYASEHNTKRTIMKMLLNVLLPAVCMILFVAHPVGGKAAAYSLFWLIPIAAYVAQIFWGTSFFLVALSGAFVAHGVGSVIWLNLIPMSPEKWLALIPIVAVERMVFTFVSYLIYKLIQRFMDANVFMKKQEVIND